MDYQPQNMLPGFYKSVRLIFRSLKDEVLHNRNLSRPVRMGSTCGGPMLQMQGQVICFDQVKDKDLFAAKSVKLYNTPPIDANGNTVAASTVIGTVGKGQRIGMLYSFVERPNGIWLMIYPFIGANAMFVKSENNAFSLTALQQQGSQTENDIQQENQSWLENLQQGAGNLFSDTVKPTQTLVKWGVPLLIGYVVYDQFFSGKAQLNKNLSKMFKGK